jgi:hypothetical protein
MELRYGGVRDAIGKLGDPEEIKHCFEDLQIKIYALVEKVPERWFPRVWHYKQIVPFLPEIPAPAFRMTSIGYLDEEFWMNTPLKSLSNKEN